jgi:hypothetical protein
MNRKSPSARCTWAVDKVIDEKKGEPIGTKETEGEVAADLNEAAREDTKKTRQQQPEKRGRGAASRKKPEQTSMPRVLLARNV